MCNLRGLSIILVELNVILDTKIQVFERTVQSCHCAVSLVKYDDIKVRYISNCLVVYLNRVSETLSLS